MPDDDGFGALPWSRKPATASPHSDEIFVATFAPHWLKSAPAFLCLLLGAGIGSAAIATTMATTAPPSALLAVGLSVATAVLHWSFREFLSNILTSTVITNKRFLHFTHRLWLKNDEQEILLSRTKTVDAVKEGLLKNIFDYGNLVFDPTHDPHAGISTVSFVPHPQRWAQQITNVARNQ